MKLLGKTIINGKRFSASDSIGLATRESLGLKDSFYGGSVKEFYKTDYGIYMCLNKKKEIINLGYFDNRLTEKGKVLLSGKQEEPFVYDPVKDEQLQAEIQAQTDRKELIAQAKSLGLKGVLENMKDETLIKKIKEAQK